MNKMTIKTSSQIRSMAEGGQKLARIKEILKEKVAEGVSAFDLELLADGEIKRQGARPSFKMVPGYSWATCVNVNQGLVHGIPRKDLVFKKGDVVSVDVGIFYKDFHSDTSFTIAISPEEHLERFLATGEEALEKAINQMVVGARIFDIGAAIQDTIEGAGYSPIVALVGHGIGRKLHEEPPVPCVRIGIRKKSPEIMPGMTLAIEMMYALGSPKLVKESDGWTISTADGKISALFEETVAVTTGGPLILTE